MSSSKIDLESISSLVPMARDGDRSAQNEVFRQVQDYVLKMANQQLGNDLRRKVNPSDIVQLTMTRMINGFEDFRGKSEAEFRGWMKTILRNEIIQTRRHLSRNKRDIKREQDVSNRSGSFSVQPGVDPNLTPSSEAIKEEKVRLLHKAMERLSEDYAQVIQLRSLDELPFDEIAKRMDRSYGSVVKLWNRAIVKLQKELDELDAV